MQSTFVTSVAYLHTLLHISVPWYIGSQGCSYTSIIECTHNALAAIISGHTFDVLAVIISEYTCNALVIVINGITCVVLAVIISECTCCNSM